MSANHNHRSHRTHVHRRFARCAGRAGAWVVAALFLLPPGATRADETTKSTIADRESLAITIYSSNLALVKDVRKIQVPTGVVNLKFEGVAAHIDPTSVYIRSLTSPDQLAILEQNFEYDLISPAKLMEKYLGRNIELVFVRDKKEIRKRARLIGNQGGYVYEIDNQIVINPPGRVVLPDLPEGLISRPTLIWMLQNGRSRHTIEASYLTGGIGWRANYVLVLSEDDREVDLTGWVTINNQSGATYNDAAIKLVAGDVHRAPAARGGRHLREVLSADGIVAEEQFKEQAFFEYHLYTLQRTSTIKENQTKQINLLDAEGVGVEKHYVFSPRRATWTRQTAASEKAKVSVFLSLENSEDNNLGKPLPKGVVRVYKKDADGALQFAGEDRIDHTPEDEIVRVKLGEAFDVVGERTQTDFKVVRNDQRGRIFESEYEIEIRNHKDEDIVVAVEEMIPGDWDIQEKSHDFVKVSSSRVRFDIPVAKKSSATLTYRVRIKY
ncbi:MAG: DUF4139 domain-containing protein [bacterium]|nr:DUF4139 domain-containing protein [bacterium]